MIMLMSIPRAEKLPYAPSRVHLYNEAKKENRAGYFIDDGDSWKINVNHKEWKDLIERRSLKSTGRKVKKPKVKENVIPFQTEPVRSAKTTARGTSALQEDPEELEALTKLAFRADLEAQILKNDQTRYKNEQEKIKLQRAAGELIEMKLATFLFFGYMERMNLDLLALLKKIEPIIGNLVKEGDTPGLVKRLNHEFKSLLITVKKSQEKDLNAWKEENGIT